MVMSWTNSCFVSSEHSFDRSRVIAFAYFCQRNQIWQNYCPLIISVSTITALLPECFFTHMYVHVLHYIPLRKDQYHKWCLVLTVLRQLLSSISLQFSTISNRYFGHLHWHQASIPFYDGRYQPGHSTDTLLWCVIHVHMHNDSLQ